MTETIDAYRARSHAADHVGLASAIATPGSSAVSFSFEFFPPKSVTQEAALSATTDRLRRLQPSFMSVTCGAGGSTRTRTAFLVTALSAAGVTCAAHITCAGAPRDEVDAVAASYWRAGIRHLVALRGDPTGGIGGNYCPHPEGYAYAADLVEGLKRIGDFEISVAGYPERHPESSCLDTELDHLKRKVDAGAGRIITQFFFENDLFEDYLEKVRAAGITVPVVPGILPVNAIEQVVDFAARTRVNVPDWLRRRFEALPDEVSRRHAARDTMAEQVFDLVERGVRDIHFYTLNRPEPVEAVCRMLGAAGEYAIGSSN